MRRLQQKIAAKLRKATAKNRGSDASDEAMSTDSELGNGSAGHLRSRSRKRSRKAHKNEDDEGKDGNAYSQDPIFNEQGQPVDWKNNATRGRSQQRG